MYEAVVIGTSAGGMNALKTILPTLPESFPLPIAVVQHIVKNSESYLAEYLNRISALTVKEAEDKEFMRQGTVYLAPPGYHLFIEPDRSFSLSQDPRVNFSCPAIDILFESAADAFENRLIGLILTGANSDGSLGLKTVKTQGGLSIVQNPETAEAGYMPRAALDAAGADHILNLEQIAPLLLQLRESPVGESHVTDFHC
ncbi:MAG: chemotaxis protein CheB [Nitrospira sp.]|nr:chemotaxis protein CheB [Nitrospira sp.]HBP87201.1 chemotaxis protein CheB [Nitrospiraceae bacterium]HNP29561.1 chemotaxis protein CheB [Nitrospirales bacterium]